MAGIDQSSSVVPETAEFPYIIQNLYSRGKINVNIDKSRDVNVTASQMQPQIMAGYRTADTKKAKRA
jgi:hypothetical protein